MVGLTSVLRPAHKSAKRKMPRGWSKARQPSAKRLARKAPASASSEFPAAMPRQAATPPLVVMFTKNAPMKTPGESQYPHTRQAASAMPVGGQNGEALTWIKANSDRASLPAAK